MTLELLKERCNSILKSLNESKSGDSLNVSLEIFQDSKALNIDIEGLIDSDFEVVGRGCPEDSFQPYVIVKRK